MTESPEKQPRIDHIISVTGDAKMLQEVQILVPGGKAVPFEIQSQKIDLSRLQGEPAAPPVHRSPVTASEYESFQKRSCLRADGFSSVYYTLGLVEEAAEVMEVVRTESSVIDVVKECGDVLWYATGLLRNFNLSLESFTGSSFSTLQADDENPEINLMLTVGALAGRIKKFERGDYDERKLEECVQQLVPKVFSSLQTILAGSGQSLQHAAECNVNKIEKRLKTGSIMGDGSNREVTALKANQALSGSIHS
jgi:NTP pyrophosphatase (non-canonical NTP hydrolase)